MSQVAGTPRRVGPLPGLRLKVNLLLLAIQVPALIILALSTSWGIQDLVKDMARFQADRLARELNNRLDKLDDLTDLQEDLYSFMESTMGVSTAAVFLVEGDQLALRALWGGTLDAPEVLSGTNPDEVPVPPEKDDYRAFHGETVLRALEEPQPTRVVIYRPFRAIGGQVLGAIRLELDETESVLQLQNCTRQLFVGMVVVFALTVLVLFGGMHLLVVSPVKKLVGAMGRTREGRLEAVAVGSVRDEIGWLARSYNEMVHRLRLLLDEKEALLGEVRDLNLNLQRRIGEATVDLAKSHRDLEQAYHDLYASQREHERLQGLASLGQVAREIAHEFATPLNVISGTLQMLLEDPALKPEHRDRLQRVLSQTERLIQKARDTLSPLRMPAPELRPADLNALVREVGAFMAPAFSSRGVQFCTRLQPRLPPIPADPHQLEQVLLNLISNALDALPSGGRIDVETREEPPSAPASGNGDSAVAITGDPEGSAVLLLVRDNGMGIAPAHLEHIFDPFFSTKGAGRGSGLGLSICKEIVTQHHGEIRIQSEPGKGSCVTVRLPAVAPKGQAVA